MQVRVEFCDCMDVNHCGLQKAPSYRGFPRIRIAGRNRVLLLISTMSAN